MYKGKVNKKIPRIKEKVQKTLPNREYELRDFSNQTALWTMQITEQLHLLRAHRADKFIDMNWTAKLVRWGHAANCLKSLHFTATEMSRIIEQFTVVPLKFNFKKGKS